jgi:hypothetical protein
MKSCLLLDDTLDVVPWATQQIEIEPLDPGARGQASTADAAQLKELTASLADTQPVGSLVATARTLDQAKAILTFVEAISEKTLRSTVTLTAGRGRGKSAALGLSIAAAISYGYSNIFVTSPSPENLATLFEFVFKVSCQPLRLSRSILVRSVHLIDNQDLVLHLLTKLVCPPRRGLTRLGTRSTETTNWCSRAIQTLTRRLCESMCFGRLTDRRCSTSSRTTRTNSAKPSWSASMRLLPSLFRLSRLLWGRTSCFLRRPSTGKCPAPALNRQHAPYALLSLRTCACRVHHSQSCSSLKW